MVNRLLASKLGRLAPVMVLSGMAGSVASSSSNNNTMTATAATARMEPSQEQSPNLQRWCDRWNAGNIRWHKSTVDPTLEGHIASPAFSLPAAGARILVPLCGKTVDMAHLAEQKNIQQVVGVDGIRKALEEFAAEHANLRIVPVESTSKFEKLQSQPAAGSALSSSIVLLKGDFFDLDAEAAGGKFDVVWDRASLVAIQPALRPAYVAVMANVLEKGGKILLSTYIRPDGDTTKGPPFSIDEDQVKLLYESESWVESVKCIDSKSAIWAEPWYKAIFFYLRMGNVQEKIFIIQAKK
jgi:thiopurine S-methyltransferase